MAAFLECLLPFLLLALAYAKPELESRATTPPPKYVFAHHIVGNTYPYTVNDWANDIALAKSYNIDAFALNIGPDSWQAARVADAYTAAKNANSTFKLFISFDMSVLPCASQTDANALINYIGTYANHPAQFKYPPSSPKVFASTFAGESCTFGQGSAANGWLNAFKKKLTGANATYFVPSFFVDPASFGSSGLAQSQDGAFNWNSAWSIGTTTNSLTSLLNTVNSSLPALPGQMPGSKPQATVQKVLNATTSDAQYYSATSKLNETYMGSLAGWFFTHYSPQTYNKNWIYLSDYLLPQRWQTIVQNRTIFDFIEIISWNDYGESHYVGPIGGAQPNSQAWVNGNNHTGWLDLISYFAQAYKTGTYPNITTDRVVMWARPHPVNATASNDSVGRPNNYQMAQDSMFAVILATAPANLALSTPLKAGQNATAGNQTTFVIPKGLSQLNYRLYPNCGMRATLTRNGKTVVDVFPATYTFNANPTTYNFNAFVANGHS